MNKDASKAFAIIPRHSYGDAGQNHAFVQVLDGKQCTASYHRFAADMFQPSTDTFFVQLEGSSFSAKGLTLALPNLSGSLQFSNHAYFPKKFLAPGIMGPFTFVPRMQCYHGIVSMDHRINGELVYHGEKISFDGGKGYLEKDWGRSFPNAYIWMQTNHFESEGVDEMLRSEYSLDEVIFCRIYMCIMDR